MNGLEKAQHIQTAKDAEIKRFTIGKVDSRKKKSRVRLGNFLIIPQKEQKYKVYFHTLAYGNFKCVTQILSAIPGPPPQKKKMGLSMKDQWGSL